MCDGILACLFVCSPWFDWSELKLKIALHFISFSCVQIIVVSHLTFTLPIPPSSYPLCLSISSFVRFVPHRSTLPLYLANDSHSPSLLFAHHFSLHPLPPSQQGNPIHLSRFNRDQSQTSRTLSRFQFSPRTPNPSSFNQRVSTSIKRCHDTNFLAPPFSLLPCLFLKALLFLLFLCNSPSVQAQTPILRRRPAYTVYNDQFYIHGGILSTVTTGSNEFNSLNLATT